MADIEPTIESISPNRDIETISHTPENKPLTTLIIMIKIPIQQTLNQTLKLNITS